MVLATRYWQDLAWPDFASLPANTVAVLPVAAIEQHGPHLPVAVDATIGNGVIEATLRRIPAELPVLVLPTQAVALSVEHLRYPGSLTTTPETLLALVTDIGASVARTGVKRMVICNSHGGNVPVLETAARRIRIEHRILVVTTAWARFGKPQALQDPVEGSFGIHAGRDETALMLALTPELVRMEHARNFTSRWQAAADVGPALHPRAGIGIGWQSQDLHPAGAVGDAASATVEMGRQILDHAATRMAELWQQVSAFDIESWLSQEPSADV